MNLAPIGSKCIDCNGYGIIKYSTCNGLGFVNNIKCSNCKGWGYLLCNKCHGSGTVDTYYRLSQLIRDKFAFK